MAEQRGARRKPVRGTGRIHLQPAYDAEVRMLDVSTMGVGIVASVPIAPGTGCSVRFPVPGPDARSVWFEARATVVDCVLSGAVQGFRIGLRFGTLPSATQEAIQAYVDS
jgi:hypothetical protein